MNIETKQDWLKRAKLHQEADRFIQGKWLRDSNSDSDLKSGCFFGCMTQLEDGALETASKEMGLPLWVVNLAERIFEGLSEDEALLFPVQFIEKVSTKFGDSDWEKLRHDLAIKRMRRNYELVAAIETQEEYKQEILDSIDLVIEYHQEPSKSAAKSAAESAAWSAAWSAAGSVVSAAESAARSAAWSAKSAAKSAESAAESAAWSAARSAAWSAKSAAWSAESAAKSATESAKSAKSAVYIQERDDLFSLMSA